jgi:Tfp pilus assembly protein PilO
MLSKKTVIAIAVIVAATVCVAACGWVVLLGSQRKAIADIDELIVQKQDEVISANDNNDDAETAFIAKMSLGHQKLAGYVLTRQEASDLGVDINRIAQKTGVHEFSSTNRMKSAYGKINECEHIVEGRIQLEFKSSFSQFAEFVNRLERFEPVIFVDDFEIKRSTANDNKHDVSLVVAFFVANEELGLAMNEGAGLGVVGEDDASETILN